MIIKLTRFAVFLIPLLLLSGCFSSGDKDEVPKVSNVDSSLDKSGDKQSRQDKGNVDSRRSEDLGLSQIMDSTLRSESEQVDGAVDSSDGGESFSGKEEKFAGFENPYLNEPITPLSSERLQELRELEFSVDKSLAGVVEDTTISSEINEEVFSDATEQLSSE